MQQHRDEPDVVQTQAIEFETLSPSSGLAGKKIEIGMDVLASVKVTLSASVGEVETVVGDIFAFHEGKVVQLNRRVDESVDLLLEGRVVARGDLVVVGDHFGVRIREVAMRKES